MSLLKTGKEVLRLEADAIRRLARRLDSRFERAVDLIRRARGRVIIMGMGKPGLVGHKLSASLASTGIPSTTLHPAEAVHGDIGRVLRDDVIIALSKSGETEEIVRVLPAIRRIGCKLIAITCNPESDLARSSDVTLDVSIEREAEPLDLVPTTSTTCMLAMGDALTMALVKKRRFRHGDFARLHPGGKLGKMLTLTVKSVMRKGPAHACVRPEDPMRQVLLRITSARAGSATVVDRRGRLQGIFTDGDLRRNIGEIGRDLAKPVKRFMTRRPLAVREDELAVDALQVFKRRQVDELPVVNRAGRVVGLLDVQDLLKQGFIL